MSILAKNLKVIRKELKCTQSAMADILKVGFRTYVRYEAGERDAPVAILVKMARLGNISLERLLTTEVKGFYISPLRALPHPAVVPEVKTVKFNRGEIIFKKPSRQELITLDPAEKKLLSIYRKMAPDLQESYLASMEAGMTSLPSGARAGSRKTGVSSKAPEGVSAREASSEAAASKTTAVRKKGKPGRKKLNKKALREKIDKLKMITRSINKITVR